MEVKQYALAGLVEFVPRVFTDDRGVFFETFSARLMAQAGAGADWVQDNQSSSKKGVLRGLHFQRPPHAQAKLVRVARAAPSTWPWTCAATRPPTASTNSWS